MSIAVNPDRIAPEALPVAAERELLVTFLGQLAPASRSMDLRDDTPLLSSGILDSLGILQLMTFLGEELGIEIADDDFTLENFESVGALLAFVRRRKAGE